MHKLELGGVQTHAVYFAVVSDRWLSARTAVFDVAGDGMAKFCQMNANLVSATGFQATFQLTVIADRSQGAKMSDRFLADGGVFRAAAESIASITDELRLHRLFGNSPRHQCKVLADGVVLRELLDDLLLRFFGSGKHQ